MHQSRFFCKGEDIKHALWLVHEKVSNLEDELLSTNKNSSNLFKIFQLVLGNFELVCLFIKYVLCFCSNVNKLQSFPVILEININ